MRLQFAVPVVLLSLSVVCQQAPPAGPAKNDLLARRYHQGQKLSYHMKANNEERGRTLAYEIQADGVVKKGSDGFFEEFAWSNLVTNGSPAPLSARSQNLRQVLSLEPNPHVGMPDLSKVDPMLIGPITDMLTFYADMLIVHTQGHLAHVNDHFLYKYGKPASWADGAYVILGQSSVDFDVTLTAINRPEHFAVVIVKHLPPEKTQANLPAEWMKPPVADAANNWVQVIKGGEGKYVASVGKEIFIAQIKLSLDDGRILEATLDNPVEVRERECSDAALTACGEPIRYRIHRQIEIK
jgi:hypothetical protein